MNPLARPLSAVLYTYLDFLDKTNLDQIGRLFTNSFHEIRYKISIEIRVKKSHQISEAFFFKKSVFPQIRRRI